MDSRPRSDPCPRAEPLAGRTRRPDPSTPPARRTRRSRAREPASQDSCRSEAAAILRDQTRTPKPSPRVKPPAGSKLLQHSRTPACPPVSCTESYLWDCLVDKVRIAFVQTGIVTPFAPAALPCLHLTLLLACSEESRLRKQIPPPPRSPSLLCPPSRPWDQHLSPCPTDPARPLQDHPP